MVQAVAIACLFEDKFCSNPNSVTSTHPRSSYTKTITTNQPLKQPPILPTPTTKPFNSPLKSKTIKNISPAEMQLRREKGICYYCDEKFSPQHRCPNKHLMLLQLDDVESVESDTDSGEQFSPSIEQNSDSLDHHLSLNAMNGCSSLGTLRFTGQVLGKDVQILVDGGSTDNFFQPRLAKFLKLPIEPVSNFNVLVGNGHKMVAEGKISNLSVSVQGHDMQIPVFLLPFAGADLILSSSWLSHIRASCG
ncbi:unnamed protein product [Trifolium pratense]|uniref:Uncharacterized protein n=1 Tax=Trifolium pratense TaxID=57577 RepID=A0ACB0KTT3_TRIPR|nr:unnamed protein product [Trifolium pratense]